MSTQLAPLSELSAQLEQVLVGGDLSKLSPADRVHYYKAVCQSVGLNPLTKPFEYINLSGKLTLYARKDCTDQLRTLHGVSVTLPHRELIDGIYVVTARATNNQGRTDESTGAVPLDGLKGEARANAMMKAESKSKRRVTLSICGLGLLDETEIESIPDAEPFREAKKAEQDAIKQLAEPYPSTLPGRQVPDAVQRMYDVLKEPGMIYKIADEFKKNLGEVEYYKVLDECGGKKITDFAKVVKMKEVLLALHEREQELSAKGFIREATPEELGVTDADLPY